MTARLNKAACSDVAPAAPGNTDPVAMFTPKAEVWNCACRRLRAGLGEAVFSAWFARLDLVKVEDGTATLSVPTTFLRTWIQSHYLDRILAALQAEQAGIERVVIVNRSTTRPTLVPKTAVDETALDRPETIAPSATVGAVPTPAKPVSAKDNEPALDASPLDKRLTFGSFLVGQSNQLAQTAAERVAKARIGEAPLYSPLYVHAAVGLGKTHLLQATAHAVTESGRRVTYLTAERFMHGFVASLKAQTALAFKDKLRAIDVLIIDDVQFLQGKTVQNEFCHTLNALIDDGRQVVVAADRPPSDLDLLEERVRSRFGGGLCVQIEALDESLRQKIIASRVAAARTVQPSFELSPTVIAYVASVITTNGRDLDGAVNRLMAHATLHGTAHTVETAEAAIRDLVRTREPKRVKIEDIQKLVANRYNVSRADILSSRRTAIVVRPRQIAMYLSKALTLRSLPEIGRRFGGRDHTTVLHAVRKIENLCTTEAALAEEIELFKRLLQD